MPDRTALIQTDIEQMEQYLTTKQLSEKTGIPEATFRYWRHVGEGPESFVLGKKRVVYKLSKLNEWLAAQENNNVRGGVA
ncbi:helix-turn-helix domain-containing protein [Rhodococcus sp. IEGM 1366]|uniref:helix-turn-helix transcriptional regulator n=1 Tax=Rhodococcus sp. IEGM 1366 TaxID=3082223 RepID=UPI002955022D|nr:helix-turn-helix domain-containing protein [Rhodococcus sp. IEGM 1366]MDV8065534.1 helix-turn-helix domain-containing protein [Rhodococcus sp. IEGM 1366]